MNEKMNERRKDMRSMRYSPEEREKIKVAKEIFESVTKLVFKVKDTDYL